MARRLLFVRFLSDQRRLNPLGIQMLSKSLYDQVFPGGEGKLELDAKAIEKSKSHLSSHGLQTGGGGGYMEDIDIKLPPLLEANISTHFSTLAKIQLEPYLPLMKALVYEDPAPSPVTQWNYESGWTRYNADGSHTSVPFPDDPALVFDVEVCVTEGHAPTLAVAASPSYWYSWVSPRLVSKKDYAKRSKVTFDELIPLEGEEESGKRERLVVGHNVSYDRARVREEYLINGSKMRFLDTLSLHVCVAGQTSAQKLLWRSARGKEKDETDQKVSMYEEDYTGEFTERRVRSIEPWMDVSSPNGLADVYKLHCGRNGEDMDKSLRDVFLKGNLEDVRNDFQTLMDYCCQDVRCTYELLRTLFPLFLDHCPNPVTLAGMLEMGSMYLPVNDSWNAFIQSATYTMEDVELEMSKKLMSLANDACSMYREQEKYKEDIWLSNLNWSHKEYRSKRKTKKQMNTLMERVRGSSINKGIAERLQQEEKEEEEKEGTLIINRPSLGLKRGTHLPRYPEWYRSLCVNINKSPWQPGPCKITSGTRVTPYLLRIKWAGHPVYYHPSLAWGYIIPSGYEEGKGGGESGEELRTVDDHYDDYLDFTTGFSNDTDDRPKSSPSTKKAGPKHLSHIETDYGITDDVVVIGEKKYYYFKIPHKNGSQCNCGNPLSKDYISKMQSGILTSALGIDGQRILQLNSMSSFWRGNEKRICNQFVLWNDDEKREAKGLRRRSQGVILPMVQVAGTVTRRAVEPTWLTASNAKEDRIGSELKAFIQAPPGYSLVGADVDSQEVWIASLLGDHHFTGIQGSTAFGWMALKGSKSEGTDVHSKTAQTIGITREQAKVFNYSRIYGSGKNLSSRLLKQFNPLLSDEEVEEKSNSLYETTKGIKRVLLTKNGQAKARSAGLTVHTDGSVSQSEYWDKFQRFPPRRGESYWSGGTESHMFNKLESIAKSPHPRTPVLNCLVSRALQKENVKTQYMTSRVNWVVQSSAVDYLHLLLVAVKWLIGYYGIDGGRLCISIHDEVRYLVSEGDRYKMAFALQVANIWTRAMFAHQLGMSDLPLNVAFFSAVDIDTVLRKEVNMDCQTPSNPQGLRHGYGINFGEAIDIVQTVEKLRKTKQLDI